MFLLNERPDWKKEGNDWPNREASAFVEAAGLTWHVQRMGEGPTALLLHGTGASTHSWRGLAPLLGKDFDVFAPDLPGHGFTEAPTFAQLTLPRMARLVSGLLAELSARPQIVIGHSAGAAIAIQTCLDHLIDPKVIVSLNGALLPFRGSAGHVFPFMAKVLFLNPLTPRVFAMGASDRRRVGRLIESTGSQIDPDGLEQYARLFSNPSHVAGALGMMANWDLPELRRTLHRLKTPLVLIAGDEDKAVPPADAYEVKARATHAEVVKLRSLGHLAHEEDPGLVAELVRDIAHRHGIEANAGA